jgi:hypothetical protein
MFDKVLLTNGTCTRKITLKNPWKASHLCPVKSPTRCLNKRNLNLKDARFIMHKPLLMMLELRQRGENLNYTCKFPNMFEG